MDESDILGDARLNGELQVGDGWAADSDSADSGEEASFSGGAWRPEWHFFFLFLLVRA